jgi:hypothetical protein
MLQVQWLNKYCLHHCFVSVCVRFAATDASIITLHNDTHKATSIKTCRALKSHTSSAGIEFRTTNPAAPHCYSHTLVLSLQPVPLYLLSHIFCNSTLKAMAGLIYSPLRTVLWSQDFSLHSFTQLICCILAHTDAALVLHSDVFHVAQKLTQQLTAHTKSLPAI